METDQKYFNALLDLARRSKMEPCIRLDLTLFDAWTVMSQLQLALRHPTNDGAPAAATEAVARSIQERLAPPGTVLAELAEMGWYREYDQ